MPKLASISPNYGVFIAVLHIPYLILSPKKIKMFSPWENVVIQNPHMVF
jgi:hypothetical protein